MIVVTGAGGRLGGAVVRELLQLTPASQIGVSTTDPEKLSDLSDQGVRVRQGDYDDSASLRHAFEGADQVLIVSAPRIGPAAIEAHRAAINAAGEAGVSRIFYTSHVGADALSPFPPAVTHAATEVLLRDSGIEFTALRNGFYADTPLRLAGAAVASGQLVVPEDAAVSWTTHADLAPGIAALMLESGPALQAINLTADTALDMAELAEIASTASGRRIEHVVVGDDEYHAGLVAAGMPEFAADMSLNIFRAARQRHLGIADPALAGILGRPTERLADLVHAAVAG